MKKALITGITGQDGSYIAELLLSKGYDVHGLVRRSSSFNTRRIDHLRSGLGTADRVHLHYGDLSDSSSLNRVIKEVAPDETYHLAAQSHVRVSFDMPEYTADVVALGTVRILNAIAESGLTGAKFYHASSSEMFGLVQAVPQNEKTPFYPRSPYACSKLFSHWMTVNYREAYGIQASNGILFNHESPRRGENFVTRKITRGLAQIVAGKEKHLFLGNLDAKRDWGYAKEYVEAMWLMLQQPKGDDYVIATGETHSIREFLQEAFSLVKLNYEEHVKLDPRHYRPTEVELLIGDARKAEKALNWKPKVRFRDLVRIMVTADLQEEGIDLRRYGLDALPEGAVP